MGGGKPGFGGRGWWKWGCRAGLNGITAHRWDGRTAIKERGARTRSGWRRWRVAEPREHAFELPSPRPLSREAQPELAARSDQPARDGEQAMAERFGGPTPAGPGPAVKPAQQGLGQQRPG